MFMLRLLLRQRKTNLTILICLHRTMSSLLRHQSLFKLPKARLRKRPKTRYFRVSLFCFCFIPMFFKARKFLSYILFLLSKAQKSNYFRKREEAQEGCFSSSCKNQGSWVDDLFERQKWWTNFGLVETWRCSSQLNGRNHGQVRRERI